jgi:ABC-type transport system involved in multi-copper enzyme maturation permease subunit
MIPNSFKVIFEVTRKELLEHFKTMRLLVIAIIFTIVFLIVAVYGNYLAGGAGGDEPAYEEGPNTVLVMMLAISTFFPPILAIALSYDSIVGERTRRSLHLLLSKPVDRWAIYVGKFLSSFLSIVIIYLVVGTVGYLLVIGLSGQIPSIEQVGNAYAAIGIILFSSACWVLFIMLFSTTFKTVTTTIIFSVLFWLFILSLIAQSGWIYYMATRETEEDPISIDINTFATKELGINYTTFTFTPRGFTLKILELDYAVMYLNDTAIEPIQLTEGRIESISPTYLLKPGEYKWTVKDLASTGNSAETVASGHFRLDEDFIPGINLMSSEGDAGKTYYNSFFITLNTLNPDSEKSVDVFIRSSENFEIIKEELNYTGDWLQFDKLDKGDYWIEVIKNGTSYLNSTIHSYGDEEQQQQINIFAMFDEDEDLPDYVKYTSALNPDNCANVYIEILTGESPPNVYLSIPEAIIALSIMFVFLFILGMLVFSRIELL